MHSIADAKELARAGRFGEAFIALSETRVAAKDRAIASVLRCELLERVGRYDEARHEASELLRSRHLNSGERSGCCLVLARVESTAGRTDSSITWLQRAVSLAQQEHDHDRMCWAKLRLLTRVAEHSGFEAASVLLRDLRMSAMQTGDPAILAAVHLYVAQTEAKRGLLASPRKHVHLALTHLKA